MVDIRWTFSLLISSSKFPGESSGDPACSHVSRNGEIHFRRGRRSSLVHDFDKGTLVDREVQAFVELLLFADGRGHPAVIIVAGIDNRVVWQREEFLSD
jgi:hypothetical protein